MRYRSLRCADDGLRKSAGMSRVARSRMVESCGKVIGSRENCRVDPRREITCSIESEGICESFSGNRAEVDSLAGGAVRCDDSARHAVTSFAESKQEAACILRIAG